MKKTLLRSGIATLFIAAALLSAVITGTPTATLASTGYPYDGCFTPENISLPALSLPAQYGTVVFRTNEQSPGQLFIVGISHRDAGNGLNHYNTAQVQLEIFRIGEWLHRERDLKLLLPEGYFNGENSGLSSHAYAAASEVDPDRIYARLADDSRFVNAEMLLMEQFGMHAAQVEDNNSYNAVCTCLAELKNKDCTRMQMTAKLDELKYLQELRTARILQRIPGAIEAQLRVGTIQKTSAMMTIGLNHIHDIVRYLKNSTITITPPEQGSDLMESYTAELDLVRKGYGITIIIPRTLADDPQLLLATQLDQMLPKDNTMLAANEPIPPPQ